MTRMFALAVGTLLISGCTTAGGLSPEAALAAAGLTRDAYCVLAPEARAEVRRVLEIRVRLLACPGDRASGARRSRSGAAGQD